MKVLNLKFWNLNFWKLKFWNLKFLNLKFWNLKFWNLKFWNWKFWNLKLKQNFKCGTTLCNFLSLFSIHNTRLWFWQLELYTIRVGKVYNRLYHLLNLAWPIDFETLQKFLRLRFCYPLHFYGEDFKNGEDFKK